tara:strand:- start:17428 stop:18150 length:723 start_codon:yes stop_codon:yes gene_type:complete
MPFSLDHVVFFGRTWDESMGMYALQAPDLGPLRILDCPGGPDGLVSEGLARGLDITAVDPQYDNSPDELERRGRREIHETVEAWIADPETGDNLERMRGYERLKIEALESFIDAFRSHPDRYVTGQLPSLPFEDDSFDLVLSGHLLFAYAARKHGGLMEKEAFDLEFHLASIRELLRVGREVRLFPTYAFFGPHRRHEFIEPVLEVVREEGHDADFLPSRWIQDEYTDFNDTLRIRKGTA